MGIKMNGEEYMAYAKEPWPEGWWYESLELLVDKQVYEDLPCEVPQDATVKIMEGMIYPNDSMNDGISVVSHARRFLKKYRQAQTHITLKVICPKVDMQRIIDELTIKGCVVRKL